MSTGEEDRIARSVALEKTYVHDVYDHMSALQYPEQRNTAPWSKVKNFLNQLEPGSIVCDVGCGSGKYLKVNPSIFKIGSDRCRKLTQIAKDDDNEVLLCDNLTLPFRDESFDAVLSIAVIHHFATKERRVGALRELTRILRIGGRLMITVWAMEQDTRNFETQDVLVQWQRPQFFRSPSPEFSTTATGTSEDEYSLNRRISQTPDCIFSRSSSCRQDDKNGRSRLQLFPLLKSHRTSPSSSSLSSPNETCYSFVKRALKKLSRSGKKEKNNSRTWLPEVWTSLCKDDHLPATRYDPEGCEEDTNIQDIPIELRRMEKEVIETHHTSNSRVSLQMLEISLSEKSKSLNDILLNSSTSSPIYRSRSSIVTIDGQKIKIKSSNEYEQVDTLKPKLVKQKKSICEESNEDETSDQSTDIKKLVNELPIFEIRAEKVEKLNVWKQKSLTDDIMSAERLREKERVRQNIPKQTSLNDDLIYRRHTLDSFKDTFFTNSTKKFQMFRTGLTSKLKNSTTNIEKVTGSSFKIGFAKIFHGLTRGEIIIPTSDVVSSSQSIRKSSSEDRGDDFPVERRCSHEENSDSSKDNSLQSDTSIDSEDSIISVIERVISKSDGQSTSPTVLTSPGPHSPKMALAASGVFSHPSSPKISQVMQYPAAKTKALSLPASPRTFGLSANIKQTFKIPPVAQIYSNGNSNSAIGTQNGCNDFSASISKLPLDESIFKLSSMEQVTANKLKSMPNKEMILLSQKLTVLSSKETEPRGDVCEGNESQKCDGTERSSLLIKNKLTKHSGDLSSHLKPENLMKSTFALVKKVSNNVHSINQSKQTRLPSYEIFNPETEDIDTDSSGVSTPDSIGSVISVKMESSNGTPLAETAVCHITDIDTPTQTQMTDTTTTECSVPDLPSNEKLQLHPEECVETTNTTTTHTIELLETTVSVASSLEHSLDTVLQYNSEGCDYELLINKNKEADLDKNLLKKHPPFSKSPEDEMWHKECRQHIVDLAENLSERLLAEIDRYKELNVNVEESSDFLETDKKNDPYLTKLSEELNHVSKLTKELSVDHGLKEFSNSGNDTDATVSVTAAVPIFEQKFLQQVVEIKRTRSAENISELRLKEDKLIVSHGDDDQSAEIESPISKRWLDSRRNTIESRFWHESLDANEKQDAKNERQIDKLEKNIKLDEYVTEIRTEVGVKVSSESSIRKLSKSKSETTCQSHLQSIDSTNTAYISERTVSSSNESVSKRDVTQTETSNGTSVESDLYELDKSKCMDVKYNSVNSNGSGGSQASLLHPGESIESSDAGDISERTGSVSDFSRQNTGSRSIITQSSASLASWSDCSKDIRFADRRTARCDGRSSSEETNPRATLIRQEASTQEPQEVKMESSDVSYSASTSQDSLTSESGGGSIMFHRYYHVFHQGELDMLIDEFVENLHVISSYYDHTNWCIIAEKVRVWTI